MIYIRKTYVKRTISCVLVSLILLILTSMPTTAGAETNVTGGVPKIIEVDMWRVEMALGLYANIQNVGDEGTNFTYGITCIERVVDELRYWEGKNNSDYWEKGEIKTIKIGLSEAPFSIRCTLRVYATADPNIRDEKNATNIPAPDAMPYPTLIRRPKPVSVMFVTNNNSYSQGDLVTLTIINTGWAGYPTIHLLSTAPWYVERKIDGEWNSIFSPVSAQVMTSLEPGKLLSWIWDQTNDKGEQVSPSVYRIGIHWNGNVSYTQEFEILSTPTPTPTPEVSGFEAICTIIGLLAVVYLIRRKK